MKLPAHFDRRRLTTTQAAPTHPPDHGPNDSSRRTLGLAYMAAPHNADGLVKRECQGGSCEKNVGTNVTNIAIIMGIGIPILVGAIVLFFLHRRNVRRLKMEDAKDPNTGLDFGLDESAPKGTGRRSLMFGGGEKTVHKPGQLSMDMNLSSPYLLPPGTQQSHDLIHSLARTFPNEQDPYRTIKDYTTSDGGSIHSFNPKDSSIHGGSKRNSVLTSRSFGGSMQPPRINTGPRSPASPVSPDTPMNPFSTPTASEPGQRIFKAPAAQEPIRPVQPIVPEIGTVSYPDDIIDGGGLEMPDAVTSDARQGGHGASPHHATADPNFAADVGIAHDREGAFDFSSPKSEPAGTGLYSDIPMSLSPGSQAVVFEPHALDTPGLAHSYDDYARRGHPSEMATPPSFDQREDDARGRELERQLPGPYDSYEPPQGLGVPQQHSKRLSVGFRPLPPNEVTESEDPEYRANRIRSFYKEYFEDSGSREPPPPLPTHHGGPQYEDYDENFLGDAAYFDVETNAFVMPYAQPVTRRAMTPPPTGRVRGGPGGRPGGRGPRGPHGPHGSMGGGMARRPWAGSTATPRPGSSASTGMRGAPKKRLPPPAVLKTLPTPSKLGNDSFAIMNAIDFAPPDSFEERAAGRSQSLLEERRAYQLKKPVASSLITAFDELAVLPSPHSLRKSSAFTNLDFAPPKKFKDSDTMSDAGSIKSNRSGISAVQLGAIRSGAGRVSRLPGDTVFTTAAMTDQLKPSWNMRT